MAGEKKIIPVVLPRKLGIMGVTGTRGKISSFQRQNLMQILVTVRPRIAHHGDCTGADTEVHMLCQVMRIPVVVHPPVDDKFRAFNVHLHLCKVLPVKPYRERDEDIVRAAEWLLALPKENSEIIRSGTWMTVRLARAAGKPVVILYPDGRVDTERVVR